jgi:leucyl/phenylalanyl-tRNA--protein transferase
MFHREDDASKVAMVATMRVLERGGFGLFDVQLPTPHLTSMGAVELPRDAYLDILAAGHGRPARWDPTVARDDRHPG